MGDARDADRESRDPRGDVAHRAVHARRRHPRGGRDQGLEAPTRASAPGGGRRRRRIPRARDGFKIPPVEIRDRERDEPREGVEEAPHRRARRARRARGEREARRGPRPRPARRPAARSRGRPKPAVVHRLVLDAVLPAPGRRERGHRERRAGVRAVSQQRPRDHLLRRHEPLRRGGAEGDVRGRGHDHGPERILRLLRQVVEDVRGAAAERRGVGDHVPEHRLRVRVLLPANLLDEVLDVAAVVDVVQRLHGEQAGERRHVGRELRGLRGQVHRRRDR
mmetsp:Transcript_663/g.2167  ORF Transcript_663/g.2167 Transcript_663/m.2167 type:complete len:279 (-) Transcript_663:3361-4197(-)